MPRICADLLATLRTQKAGALARRQICGCLDLGVSRFQGKGNEFPSFMSHQSCGILLQHPKWTRAGNDFSVILCDFRCPVGICYSYQMGTQVKLYAVS